MTKKTGAGFARHRSDQAIGTPTEFLDAVRERFGSLKWDLAATLENRVCLKYFGPGSSDGNDSLREDWSSLLGTLWLNPPFGNISPWAAKLAKECRNRTRLALFLVPASVGSKWFQTYCVPHSHVIELTNRITFVGQSHGYPKDLVLCVYGCGLTGRSSWAWDNSKKRK